MNVHLELAEKAHLPFTTEARKGRSDLAYGTDATVRDWLNPISPHPGYIVIPRLNALFCNGGRSIVFGGLTIDPPPAGRTCWGKCFPEFLAVCKVP